MGQLLCYIRPCFGAFFTAHIMFLTEIATAALRSTRFSTEYPDYTSIV